MRITLEITEGPEAGRKVWLGKGQSITVGRTQLAEFSVPGDSQLSSVHFQMAWQDGEFRLRDLKSTNGTWLNGKVTQEAALRTGDLIIAGKTRFAVVIEVVGGTVVLDAPQRAVMEPHPDADERDDEPSELLVMDNRTPFSVVLLPWQNADGAGRLTVIIKATYRFTESNVSLAEPQLPVWFADQHDDDPLQPVRFEADTAPFKPRADVVLVGKAYTPGGRPRSSVDVRLRVGSLTKRLRVFGDRRWLFPTRLAVVPHITDPTPFTEMPLTYTRAYGGIDEPAARYCAENLTGVGFIGEPAPASMHNKPLPNIEDPDHLIKSWDTRPKPAGFGFYGRGWQPRLRYAGTYDDAYRRTRAPRPPEDFSYESYNGAHPDLQIAGYLDGDELVELDNVCREGNVKFILPGVRPRVTLTRSIPAPQPLPRSPAIQPRTAKQEGPVKPFLDTLVLIPDTHLFYVVFRVVFAVGDLDQLDVAGVRVE